MVNMGEMGQESKAAYLKLKWYAISAFVLMNVLDIITTVMATHKHSMEIEANPIIAGLPFWLMAILKISMVCYFVWLVIKYYPRSSPIIRYLNVYLMVLLTFILAGVVINNYNIYLEDHVTPLPQEERAAYMAEAIGNAEPIRIGKMPLLFVFIPLNIIQFLVWRSFERWTN